LFSDFKFVGKLSYNSRYPTFSSFKIFFIFVILFTSQSGKMRESSGVGKFCKLLKTNKTSFVSNSWQPR